MRIRTPRRAVLSTAIAAGLAAVIVGTTQPLAAQTPYVPYFGKNQIRYDHFR
jgi:hypothetical protein